MSETGGRSVATLQVQELLGTLDLDVLQSRAAEVRAARKGRRPGDLVGVAAEVQRLGFAIERVQQR